MEKRGCHHPRRVRSPLFDQGICWACSLNWVSSIFFFFRQSILENVRGKAEIVQSRIYCMVTPTLIVEGRSKINPASAQTRAHHRPLPSLAPHSETRVNHTIATFRTPVSKTSSPCWLLALVQAYAVFLGGKSAFRIFFEVGCINSPTFSRINARVHAQAPQLHRVIKARANINQNR